MLAHRVSLVALHAGALEIRPDQAPAQVQATAALIRVTARQALTELRDVIGVLRDREAEPDAPHAPPPTLADIESLVAEFKAAGLNVTLDMRVKKPESAPGGLGRDTYRIVREGLTNVTKHASGTVATVEVSGQADEGLHVVVRNRLPLGYQDEALHGSGGLPGSGLGLVSLAERLRWRAVPSRTGRMAVATLCLSPRSRGRDDAMRTRSSVGRGERVESDAWGPSRRRRPAGPGGASDHPVGSR